MCEKGERESLPLPHHTTRVRVSKTAVFGAPFDTQW